MSLLQQIRNDLDQARRDKNKTLLTTLTTLYSESANVGKTKRNSESTDEEVLSIVRKFRIGVEELIKIKGINSTYQEELKIYDWYLPQPLSTDQLTNIIELFVSELPEKNPKQMGVIMGKLKSEYLGRYDGTLASTLTKQLLS